jgi:hemolysin III
LGIVWAMALVGVALKAFILHAPRWLTAGIYLLMGWISIMAIEEMLSSMPRPAFHWLVAGGLAFTFGAIIYVSKKPDFYPRTFGFHEVWHLFVIAGCFCHFVVIARYIAL